MLAVDEDDELVDVPAAAEGNRAAHGRSSDEADFASVMLEHLKTSGFRQAHREDRIVFTSITGWPGKLIGAEGRFVEDTTRGGKRRSRDGDTTRGGEPDIDIDDAGDDEFRVRISGVDVCHPQSGEIRSSGPDGIARRFIDTDYKEEGFFDRHAYFPDASAPYKALKTTLKAETDQEVRESLHGDTSRPIDKPRPGRVAVKGFNHPGDEAMKAFGVG